MHFSGGINRPPYEAADGYLQTTEGCSHNICLFCNMYQDIPFRMLPMTEAERYLVDSEYITGAAKIMDKQGLKIEFLLSKIDKKLTGLVSF